MVKTIKEYYVYHVAGDSVLDEYDNLLSAIKETSVSLRFAKSPGGCNFNNKSLQAYDVECKQLKKIYGSLQGV